LKISAAFSPDPESDHDTNAIDASMVEVCGEDATALDEVGLCDQYVSRQRRERIPSEDKFVLECGGREPSISQLLERRKNMRQILVDQRSL
jgi:hypothetical protein